MFLDINLTHDSFIICMSPNNVSELIFIKIGILASSIPITIPTKDLFQSLRIVKDMRYDLTNNLFVSRDCASNGGPYFLIRVVKARHYNGNTATKVVQSPFIASLSNTRIGMSQGSWKMLFSEMTTVNSRIAYIGIRMLKSRIQVSVRGGVMLQSLTSDIRINIVPWIKQA